MSFDLINVNGLGDGSLGDVTISNAATQVNSYANVTAISSDGKTLTIGSPSLGSYGSFSAGQEIMFHVTGCLASATTDLGKYGFAKILSVGTGQIVLDTAIPIVSLSRYVCQVITVPNFNNLTVSCAISALAYSTTGKYGGILIVKAKDTLDLTGGSLLAVWKGIPRGTTDSTCSNSLRPEGITTSNADIIDQIIMPQGNGIVMAISATLSLSPTSRLGATWSGALGATLDGVASANGGAGYGGGGSTKGGNSSHCVASTNLRGGSTDGSLGGYSGYCGGNGGYYPAQGTPGAAGAVVIILSPVITGFTLACFSTGGGGGYSYATGSSDYPRGGGGPGFGYIGTQTTTIATDTISYALDTGLIVNKRALITNQKSLDCSVFTSVDGFTFGGAQPSGTDRRLMFSLGATKVAGSRTYPITTNTVAADTVTICGVTLTAVASGATGNQFNVGASVGTTAANIAAALNANATFTSIYTATANSTNGIVTVTENSSHVGYGNTPAAATKTGTIVFGSGTTVTSVPTWYKLTVASGVATMTAVATQTPTLDSVLSEGNSITDLTSITSIPAFVGQKVYVSAALMAPFGATVMPTLSVTINGHNNQDRYSKTEYSAEYTLAATDVSILSVTADTTTTGQAAATVMVSLKQSGTWSGWMTMLAAKGQKASAIKYKATYTVSALGGADTAKVNKTEVIYCAGTSTVSGDTADILTITQDYENGLSFAQCVVKHKALMDAQIKAFVSFRSASKKRTMINVGTGNGSTQTVKLGIGGVADTGINHNTLSVQFDSKPVYNCGYNTETSELTFTADTGVAVTASYEYGWEAETWAEMTAQAARVYNDSGYYGTKFTYTLPSGTANKTISDIKVQLYRPSGTVTNAVIGTATGQRQLFVLPHYAKKETISCSGSWSYDDDNRILTVVAAKDSQIKASYDWIAETHEIYGLTAGWAE